MYFLKLYLRCLVTPLGLDEVSSFLVPDCVDNLKEAHIFKTIKQKDSGIKASLNFGSYNGTFPFLSQSRSADVNGCWVNFQGKQLYYFHFCLPSLWGSTLEGRICFSRNKFFSLIVDNILEWLHTYAKEVNRKSQKLFPFVTSCPHTG